MPRRDMTWQKTYLIVSIAVLVLLTFSGLMHPWYTADTASWLAPCSGTACFASARFPLYRIIDLIITLGGRLPALLPWIQVALFLLAGFLLANASQRAGASARAAAALALAFPLSNMLLIWGRAEIPEILARAALIAALAATLDAATPPASIRATLRVGIFGTAAYLFDPAQLPFIAVLPALILWLQRRGPTARAPWRQPAFAAVMLMFPFLVIASFRLETFNSFNIVSFGGYEISGIAAEILTPATEAELPPKLRPIGAEILARKADQIRSRLIPPTPANATGHAALASEAIGYFDIFARYYDVLLREAVLPIRQAQQSWVSFNSEMQHFSLAVIYREKLIYALWIAGALARLAGRMTMLNLPFALSSAALLLALILRRAVHRPAPPARDISLLTGVTASYTIGTSILGCVVAFPAQRYIDGAGLLITAWPLYACLHLTGLFAPDRP